MRVHHGQHRGWDPREADAGPGERRRGPMAARLAAHFGGRGFDGGFDNPFRASPFGGDFGEAFGGPRGGRGGHGGGPRGGGPRGGGPRGGGRRRMFASGELRLLLLHLVAQQPRHGYELIKAIEELAGGDYAPSPGVVYPTLSLLLDEGAIIEAEGDGPRKAFAVADAGRAELEIRGAEAQSLVERLEGLAQERQRHDSPPIRRAVANLFSALRNRAMAGGFDTETGHKIADILDDAARRIERI